MADLPTDPLSLRSPSILVSLTTSPLSPQAILSTVRRPTAGALLLFAGTTRSISIPTAAPPAATSEPPSYHPVSSLSYTSYPALALRSMLAIAEAVKTKHAGLEAITVVHRLGEVPVGEESVVIAVSGRHRREVFEGGEECLEEVKRKVEVWKCERFADGEGEEEWRSNEVDGGLVKGVREREKGEEDEERLGGIG